ncbi:hypothetical protein D3C73_1490150 [compost metagenome]
MIHLQTNLAGFIQISGIGAGNIHIQELGVIRIFLGLDILLNVIAIYPNLQGIIATRS